LVYRPHRMRSIVRRIARFVVCMSVCWAHRLAVQKWLNRSPCRPGDRLMWAQGTVYQIGCTLAPSGEYDWMIFERWRCGPVYFGHLLLFVFNCVCLHNLRISLLLFVGSPSNVGLTRSVLTLRTHNSLGTVTVEYIPFSGIATGSTGVDMSTPLLLEVAPEIDTNPTSFYRY